MKPIKGHIFTIELTEDAEASHIDAFGHVPGSQDACKANLLARIQRFADMGTRGLRYPDQLNDEGNGFYAIKARCGLRAYFWYSKKRRYLAVISHFIYKTQQNLDELDKVRMIKNRTDYDGE